MTSLARRLTIAAAGGALVALALPASAQAASAPITTISVGGTPTGTVVANGRAYVANESLNEVHVIDLASGKLLTNVSVGTRPQPPAASPDGSKVFVSCGDNTLRVISTSSNTQVASVPVGNGPGKPIASNTRVYVSNVNSNDVSVVDTASNTVIATIPVGTNPTTGVFGTGSQYQGFSTNLYVANRNSGSISIIDTSTNSVTGQIYSTPQISEAAVAPVLASVGPLLYDTNISGGQLTVLSQDPARASATPTFIAVGNGPGRPAVNVDGTVVYVANSGDGTVSAVNVESSKVTATIPVGVNPGDPIADASASTIYVPNTGGSTISAISTKTNAVRAYYQVGKGPLGVSLSPDGATLVASNMQAGSVSIVKTAASAYPKAPTKVSVSTSTSKQGKVTWKKSTSSGVTGYIVTALPGGKTCSTTKTTCTVKKLTGGVKYTFSVQAKSKYGAGAPGTSKAVTVKK